MVKYCPIGYINETEELCREEACAWWFPFRQCCGLLMFADTLARLEEKVPSYGKPIIRNTTERDKKRKEARILVAERLDAKRVQKTRATQMVEYCEGKPEQESWRGVLAYCEGDIEWMEKVYELLKDADNE